MAEPLPALNSRMCVRSVLCRLELSFWHSCEMVLMRHSQQMPDAPSPEPSQGLCGLGNVRKGNGEERRSSHLLSPGSCGELCSIARFSFFVSCQALLEMVKEDGAGAGESKPELYSA